MPKKCGFLFVTFVRMCFLILFLFSWKAINKCFSSKSKSRSHADFSGFSLPSRIASTHHHHHKFSSPRIWMFLTTRRSCQCSFNEGATWRRQRWRLLTEAAAKQPQPRKGGAGKSICTHTHTHIHTADAGTVGQNRNCQLNAFSIVH